MKKIIYAIFAGVLLVAVSCVEEESPETYLQIVQSDIDFDAAGGSGEILISTNAASVEASSDKSWVTVDGTSSESVRFTVSSSDREFSRVANLTITADGVSQEVTISQMGLIFDITSDELSDGLEIAAAGGSVSFTYSTTGQEPVITIPETDNWLSCTVADGTVTLSAEVNLSGADRSTEVSVAAGWKTMSLSVSQARVPLLEQTEFEFSRDAVSQTVSTTEYVSADIEWSVLANDEWITAEKTPEGISFSFGENTTGALRTGTISMLDADNNVIETVTVSQRIYSYRFFLGTWALSVVEYDLNTGEEVEGTYRVTLASDDAGTGYIMTGLPVYNNYTAEIALGYDESGEIPVLSWLGQICTGLTLSAGSTTVYVGCLACTVETSFYYGATMFGLNLIYNMNEAEQGFIIEDNGAMPSMTKEGQPASGFVFGAYTSSTDMSQETFVKFTKAYLDIVSMTRVSAPAGE